MTADLPIVVENLSFRYRDRQETAIQDISFLADKGEILLIASLRRTLSAVVEVLSLARSAAKGVEWQARLLALFPPIVLTAMAVVAPDMSRMWSSNPLYLMPALIGSGVSYLLSMRMIRTGLSIEASVGLNLGESGEIRLDRMGRVL